MDLKTNSDVQNQSLESFLGAVPKLEAKSNPTSFEGFLNAWKPGVWRNSFVKTPPVWGLPFCLLWTNHQKIGFWFAPSNSMEPGMGSVVRKVCPISKSCCFNNRCWICFPTHPQAHFTFHSCTTVGSAPRSRMCVFFVSFPSESSWMCLLLLLIQGFQISLWLGLAIMIYVQTCCTGSDMTNKIHFKFRNPCSSGITLQKPHSQNNHCQNKNLPVSQHQTSQMSAPVYFESFPEWLLVGWFHPFFGGGWLDQ